MGKVINTGFVVGCVLMILACPVILIYQTVRWLENAVWPRINLWNIADEPTTRWLGVQKIIDWFWSLPLTVLLPSAGALFLTIFLIEMDELARKAKESGPQS